MWRCDGSLSDVASDGCSTTAAAAAATTATAAAAAATAATAAAAAVTIAFECRHRNGWRFKHQPGHATPGRPS